VLSQLKSIDTLGIFYINHDYLFTFKIEDLGEPNDTALLFEFISNELNRGSKTLKTDLSNLLAGRW
jgi:hypothetical protein